jgi:hypothetical protein
MSRKFLPDLAVMALASTALPMSDAEPRRRASGGQGPLVPKTGSPVSFKTLQLVLNSIGYRLFRHDPEKPVLHWEKDTPEVPLITTPKPDFRAKRCDDPVYDRDCVIALIMNLTGTNKIQASDRILAVLHGGEQEPY